MMAIKNNNVVAFPLLFMPPHTLYRMIFLSLSSSFGFCFCLENFWLRDSCELIYVLESGWFLGSLGTVGIGRICHDYLLEWLNWTVRRSAREMDEYIDAQLKK